MKKLILLSIKILLVFFVIILISFLLNLYFDQIQRDKNYLYFQKNYLHEQHNRILTDIDAIKIKKSLQEKYQFVCSSTIDEKLNKITISSNQLSLSDDTNIKFTLWALKSNPSNLETAAFYSSQKRYNNSSTEMTTYFIYSSSLFLTENDSEIVKQWIIHELKNNSNINISSEISISDLTLTLTTTKFSDGSENTNYLTSLLIQRKNPDN